MTPQPISRPNPSLPLLGILFFLGLACGLRAEEAPGIQEPLPEVLLAGPRWSKGDSWTVKTEYAELVLGKKHRQEMHQKRTEEGPKDRLRRRLQKKALKLTTYWTYKVVRSETLEDGREVYIVQSKDERKEKDSLGSMLFSRFRTPAFHPEVDAFGMLEAKFWTTQMGEPVQHRQAFNMVGDRPRPVLPELGVIPHSFPSFPLVGPADEGTTFEDTRETGGMAFAFDSVQEITPEVDAKNLPGGDEIAEKLEAAKLPTRGLFLVEVHRSIDGASFRQLWATGYPWPLYQEDPWSSSVLVYHFTKAPTPKESP